jgi:hypothetical protein
MINTLNAKLIARENVQHHIGACVDVGRVQLAEITDSERCYDIK